MMRRSVPITKFLARRRALTDAMIDRLWTCVTTGHESVAAEVLQLLGQIADQLSVENVAHLIACFERMPKHDYTAELLQFLSEMSKKSTQSAQRLAFLTQLRAVVCDEQASNDISRTAVHLLTTSTHGETFRPHRREWMLTLLETIVNPLKVQVSSSCMQLLTHLIEMHTAQNESDTPHKVVQWLQEEHMVIDKMLAELHNFQKLSRAVTDHWSESQRSDANVQHQVLIGRQSVATEITIRLTLFYRLLSNYHSPMNHIYVAQMWEELFDHAVIKWQRIEFLNWLTHARAPSNYMSLYGTDFYQLTVNGPCLDLEQAAELFKTKMLSAEVLAAVSQDRQTFYAFQRYMCDANVLHGVLKWSEHSDVHRVEFQVLSYPPQGIEALWHIALTSEHSSVVELAAALTQRLASRAEYLAACIHRLAEARAHVTSEPAAVQQLERVLTLLSSWMNAVEGEYKPVNAASSRGRPLTLVIKNTVRADDLQAYVTGGEQDEPSESEMRDTSASESGMNIVGPRYLTVAVHSRMLLRELRALITAQLTQHTGPLTEALILSTVHGVLSGDDHSLNELALDNEQEISAAVLKNTTGRMSMHKPRSRTMMSLEDKPPSDAKDRIAQLSEIYNIAPSLAQFALKKHSWEVERVAMMLTDEERFAEIKAQAIAAGVTDDMSGEAHDVSAQIATRVLEANRPSQLLAENSQYFDELFAVLALNRDDLTKLTWSLLRRLPPPRTLTDQVQHEQPDWSAVLPHNVSLLHYLLEHVMPRIQAQALQFIKTHGLTRVIELLVSSDLFDMSRTVSAQSRQCLLQLLHLVYNLVLVHGDLARAHLTDMHIRALITRIDAFLTWVGVQAQTASAEHVTGDLSEITLYSFHLLQQLVLGHRAQEQSHVITDQSPLFFVKDWQAGRVWQYVLALVVQSRVRTVRHEAVIGLMHVLRALPVPLALLTGDKDAPQQLEISLSVTLLQHVIAHLKPMFDAATLVESAEQYFLLLAKLLTLEFTRGHELPYLADLVALLAQHVRDRAIHETRNTTDHVLAGALQCLMVILEHRPQFITEFSKSQDANFALQLYYDLFAIPTARVGDHAPPKCKSDQSRAAALSLLSLLSRDEHNLRALLDKLNTHHSGPLRRFSTWEYHPGTDDKSIYGYSGITNLGATCYMNSLLQQFYMMRALRESLLRVSEAQLNSAALEDNVLYQLQHLFVQLQETQKMAADPTNFCKSYKDLDGRPTNVREQHDVDEFFNLLCQRLEAQLKHTADGKLLNHQFGGTLANEIKSTDQDWPYYSEREEEFFSIPLDIKNKPSLEEALDSWVKSDKLEGDNAYYCDQYGRKVNAHKRCCIKQLSNTLIFHLKRFDYDYINNRKIKLNDYFQFPLSINMKSWTKEGLAGHESGGEEMSVDDAHYQYQLVGVLVHTGSADSGHYYSFIKERDSHRWLCFNDHRVYEFSPDHVPEECFGGTQQVNEWDSFQNKTVVKDRPRERSAYMLFYERVTPVNDVTAPTEVSENKYLTDAKQAIWSENAQYLRDRQFFDSNYFEFLLELLANWQVTPVKDASVSVLGSDGIEATDDTTMKLLKTTSRFFFEILAHAKDNELATGHWAATLSKVLRCHVPAAMWLLQWTHRHHTVKNILLECPNERTRIACIDIVLAALSACVGHAPEAWTIAETFINGVLDYMEATRQVWRRFKQYWTLLRDFAALHFQARHYLLSRDMITVLVDYFMGNSKNGQSRASVMDNTHLPDLTEFIDLLVLLVRGCWTEAESGAGSVPASVSDDPMLAVPPRATPTLWSLPLPLLTMPEAQRKMLFDATFMPSLLEMDYNTPSTVIFLAHVSFEAPARSKQVCETVLQLIDRASQHKMPIYQQFVEALLCLPDSLQAMRVHWLLTPFKTSTNNSSYYGGAKGLLGQIEEQSDRNERAAFTLTRFLLRLSVETTAVDHYLMRRISKLMKIKELIDDKLEGEVKNSAADNSEEDLGSIVRECHELLQPLMSRAGTPMMMNLKGEDGADEELKEMREKLEKMRRDMAQLEHQVTVLKHQNSELTQQNNELKQTVRNQQEKFRVNSPEPVQTDMINEVGSDSENTLHDSDDSDGPPPLINENISSRDIHARHNRGLKNMDVMNADEAHHRKSYSGYDDDEMDMEMADEHTVVRRDTPIPLPPPEGDWITNSLNELAQLKPKIDELKEIFSDISEDVIIEALRFHHSNVGAAANDLSEPERIVYFSEEASKAKKLLSQQNAMRSDIKPTMGDPL
jgi:ubiquitin C-terminal hydrolase